MEITRREIVASVTIIAIMLLIGTILSGKVSEAVMDSNEKYNKAIEINNTELFKYGMDTSVGNAFIYGELKAVDPVSLPNEIKGEYLSIKKNKEEYTMHTRVVSYTDSSGNTRTKTETYWTWDVVDTWRYQATKVNFCGVDFKYSQFNKISNGYIDTIYKGVGVRYVYYGAEPKHTGTAFAFLENKNVDKNGLRFYPNKTIEETIEYLESGSGMLIGFWVFWIVLTVLVVYLFYYLENKWLYS